MQIIRILERKIGKENQFDKICRPGLPDRAAIFVLYDLQMKNINIKCKIYLTYAMRKSRMTIKGGAE